MWYIPGDINASDGLTKSLSSGNLGNLLVGNMFRLAKESWGKEIGGGIPSAKRYILYHETIQGKKDLNTDMRRMARVGRCWQTVKFPFPNNSFFAQNELAQQKPIAKGIKLKFGRPKLFTWRKRAVLR